MNTPSLSSKLSGLASALIFSAVAATTVQPSSAAQTENAALGCPGSELVTTTAMKPALPNGRGAMVAVQTGTERVCHMCPVSGVTVTNAWPSGRGPTTKVEGTKVGATHNCTSGCGGSAKS